MAQDVQYIGENSSSKVPNKDKVLRIPSYNTLVFWVQRIGLNGKRTVRLIGCICRVSRTSSFLSPHENPESNISMKMLILQLPRNYSKLPIRTEYPSGSKEGSL